MVSYIEVKDKRTGMTRVLILIVMDNGLLQVEDCNCSFGGNCVLILIVMDNGLLPESEFWKGHGEVCLNPYCNG